MTTRVTSTCSYCLLNEKMFCRSRESLFTLDIQEVQQVADRQTLSCSLLQCRHILNAIACHSLVGGDGVAYYCYVASFSRK